MAKRHSSLGTAAPSSALDIDLEVARLQGMTVKQLRERFAEIFGESTNSKNRIWLVRRIAWRMQANAYGGLSERALQRARELAATSTLRQTAPRPKSARSSGPTIVRSVPFGGDTRLPLPGAEISREYKGRTILVRVLPKGFEFSGQIYKSLSAVAKHITGSHCNGYHFFRLGKEGAA